MKKSHIMTLLLAFAFFVFDYFFKWIAQQYLRNPVEIASWLKFYYTQNTGVAWSVAIPQQILIPVNIILIGLIVYYGFRHFDLRKSTSKIALALLIGGGLGNIYDRLVNGFVIDFISVGTWPVFNLADAYLTIGVFLIIVFYGKIRRLSHSK